MGIVFVLTTPEESIIEQSYTLGFSTSNNEAEYEPVLAGLRAAITLEVTGLEVQCDSSLVVNQASGDTSQASTSQEMLEWRSTNNSFSD